MDAVTFARQYEGSNFRVYVTNHDMDWMTDSETLCAVPEDDVINRLPIWRLWLHKPVVQINILNKEVEEGETVKILSDEEIRTISEKIAMMGYLPPFGILREKYAFSGDEADKSIEYFDTVMSQGYDGDHDELAFDAAHKFGSKLVFDDAASFRFGLFIGKRSREAARYFDGIWKEEFRETSEYGRKEHMTRVTGFLLQRTEKKYGVHTRIIDASCCHKYFSSEREHFKAWTYDGERRTDTEVRRLIGRGANEVFILDGPSGCGKTQLVRTFDGDETMILSCKDLVDEVISRMEQHSFYPGAFCRDYFGENKIIGIEDVDLSLNGKDKTAELVGSLVEIAASRAVVILTGIGIEERVPALKEKFRYTMIRFE